MYMSFVHVFFIADSEREIIENYFHLGYKYDIIVQLLKDRHNIVMNVRTLKRKLALLKLKRRGNQIIEQDIRNIIKDEIKDAGCLSGYRKIWHVLRIKHHLHVPRTLVARILHELNPEASNLRKARKLKRRQYLSSGPNQCWHIDGMNNK
jgi:hypothetical protein